MLRPLLAAALTINLALPLGAQPIARIEPVYEVLGVEALIEIMREEGIGYGAELEADLFPGQGRGVWAATVERIYGLERMQTAIREGLDAELSDAAVAEIVDFFDTPEGERIVALEVAARRAMLDKAVEETAREGWMAQEAEGGARWDLLIEFAEVNDLVELNVAGAMTSNYAFYMGLIDGHAFDFEMTEDQVLGDVWSQEQAIRDETVDWVFSFTSLAYQPLSDEEFSAYVEFTATPAGKALNAALFSAFNEMFAEISHELGLGASRFLSGQDI